MTPRASIVAAALAVTPFSAVPTYYSLGDSITWGYANSSNHDYPSLVAQRSRQSLRNLAFPGAKISDVLNYEILNVGPDARLITVNIGVNDEIDIAHNRESLSANQTDLVAIAQVLRSRAPRAVVLFLTPEDHTYLYGVHATPNVVAAVHAATQAIDHTIKNMGFSVCDIGNNREYYNSQHFNITTDVIHPNDAGSAFIADTINKCLEHDGL